jgi:hypothetical protein
MLPLHNGEGKWHDSSEDLFLKSALPSVVVYTQSCSTRTPTGGH